MMLVVDTLQIVLPVFVFVDLIQNDKRYRLIPSFIVSKKAGFSINSLLSSWISQLKYRLFVKESAISLLNVVFPY
ncbi:MAG: hypothetical protein HW415_1497 [Deltaproteobacteria bacterium]|nr:hypothetical protein [Deltaproteobacteria bacterium]